jgi:hypothetical protein
LNPRQTAADKEQQRKVLERGRPTMLAEIFLMRVEAILRASKEAAASGNPRFVPMTLAR